MKKQGSVICIVLSNFAWVLGFLSVLYLSVQFKALWDGVPVDSRFADDAHQTFVGLRRTVLFGSAFALMCGASLAGAICVRANRGVKWISVLLALSLISVAIIRGFGGG